MEHEEKPPTLLAPPTGVARPSAVSVEATAGVGSADEPVAPPPGDRGDPRPGVGAESPARSDSPAIPPASREPQFPRERNGARSAPVDESIRASTTMHAAADRTGPKSEGTKPEGAPKAPARAPRAKRPTKGPETHPNNVRRLRIERMMSKAELARRANLSVLTIDRVEKGFGCRMDTKRKILDALGLSLGDRVRVFGEEE